MQQEQSSRERAKVGQLTYERRVVTVGGTRERGTSKCIQSDGYRVAAQKISLSAAEKRTKPSDPFGGNSGRKVLIIGHPDSCGKNPIVEILASKGVAASKNISPVQIESGVDWIVDTPRVIPTPSQLDREEKNFVKQMSSLIEKKNELLRHTDAELESILCPSTSLDAWNFRGSDIREAIEGKRILNPSIDLSNACNLNCPYCYVEKVGSLGKRKNENELTLPDYLLIIDKLAEAGARTINIIGGGEPTVDPNFREIAQHIKSLGIKVLVATNGIEISKSDSLLHFLSDIEASVVLKVNSFDGALQDTLVGKTGYATARDIALKRLIENGFNKAHPTRLGINTLLLKSNIDKVFDIFTFCRENNITFISGNYMPTGRTEASIFQGDYLLKDKSEKILFEAVSTEQYKAVRRQILEYDTNHGYPVDSPDAYISGLPCIQGLGIQIDNEGKIWHCPARHQVIDGNLLSKEICSDAKSQNLSDLWKSETYLLSFRNNYDGQCPYKRI